MASTYALRTVTDQLALDLAAKQSGADVDQKIATALLDKPNATDLNGLGLAGSKQPQVASAITAALLPFTDTADLNFLLALRDGRLDSAETADRAGRRFGSQGHQARRAARRRRPNLAVRGPPLRRLQTLLPRKRPCSTPSWLNWPSSTQAAAAILQMLRPGQAGEITCNLLLGTNTLRNLYVELGV